MLKLSSGKLLYTINIVNAKKVGVPTTAMLKMNRSHAHGFGLLEPLSEDGVSLFLAKKNVGRVGLALSKTSKTNNTTKVIARHHNFSRR